jgi:hypothetical protein
VMLQPGTHSCSPSRNPRGRADARATTGGRLVAGTLPEETVRARVEKGDPGRCVATTAEVDGRVGRSVRSSRILRAGATSMPTSSTSGARVERGDQRCLPAHCAPALRNGSGRSFAGAWVSDACRLHVREAPSASSARDPRALRPAATGQLLPETSDLIARLSFRMRGEQAGGSPPSSSPRTSTRRTALHLECDRLVAAARLADLFDDAGLTGVSLSAVDDPSRPSRDRPRRRQARSCTAGAHRPRTLRRRSGVLPGEPSSAAASLARVLELIPDGLDLYAGVRLFAVSLAAAGQACRR